MTTIQMLFDHYVQHILGAGAVLCLIVSVALFVMAARGPKE